MTAARAIPIAVAALSGVLFGFGLAVSRMIDPEKVKDFLDFAAIPQGGWDPSLMFVMGGAALVAFFGLRLDRILRKPLSSMTFSKPIESGIDRPLVLGAAIFGLGWGLSGLCPGPAIANLGLIPTAVLPFIVAMFAGSWAAGAVTSIAGRRAQIDAAE